MARPRGALWCVSCWHPSAQVRCSRLWGAVILSVLGPLPGVVGWLVAGSKTREPGRHHEDPESTDNDHGTAAAPSRRGETRHSGGTGEAQRPYGCLLGAQG